LARELETRRQALTDAQREQLVTTAKERSEIKALNLIAEDTTKNINDRIAAADEAGAKERALFEQRKANAEEELAIIIAQNELADSGEEDRQRQAELEAEVFNLAAESLELQTTLQNKLNTLKLESINLTRQQLQAEIDLANETVEGMKNRAEKQLDITRVQLEAMNQVEGKELQLNQNVVGYTETAEEEKRRLRRETFEDFKNNAELAAHQGLQFASLSLQAVGALSEAFTKDDEKRAKRTFEIGKKLAIVQAVMNTAEGVTTALTDKTQPSTILRILQTAAVATAGAAQIATIKRQEFNAGGSASMGAVSQNARGTTGAIPQSPQLDLGFLGAGAGQAGFRSYVIASEVSNSQQANQRINDQASLVG